MPEMTDLDRRELERIAFIAGLALGVIAAAAAVARLSRRFTP